MKFLLPPLGLPLCLPAKNNFPSSKSFLALNSLLSVPMTLSEFTPPPVSGFQSAGTSNPTAVQFYVRLRFSSLVSAPAGQHVGSFQSLTTLLSLSLGGVHLPCRPRHRNAPAFAVWLMPFPLLPLKISPG